MFESKDADCPLWKSKCKGEQCRWFTRILGKHPQSDEMLNKSGCAIEFLPMLLIENAQQARQTGASVDRMNNDILRINNVSATMREILSPPNTKLIEQ